MFGRSRLALTVTAVLVGAGWVLVAPPNVVAAAPPPGVTQRVSVQYDGLQSAGGGANATVSGDGNQVVFTSYEDLSEYYVGSDGEPGQAVYVRDRLTNKTVQISVGSDALGVANGTPPTTGSSDPSISASGRFVSFVTPAGNVVGPVNGNALVVCDRDADGNGRVDDVVAPATYPNLKCIKVADLNIVNSAPELSSDGSRIVWVNYDQQPSAPVANFVRVATIRPDPEGPLVAPTPGDILDLPSSEGNNYFDQTQPRISGNGSTVVTTRNAGGLLSIWATTITDTLTRGAQRRVDFAPGTDGNDYLGGNDLNVRSPTVSDDGTVLAFTAEPPPDIVVPFVDLDLGLAPRQAAAVASSGPSQVYAVKLSQPTPTSVLVSRTSTGASGNGIQPSLSGDGRYIAFVTDRSDIYDAATAPQTPPVSCVGDPSPTTIHGHCQVVARDLVRDEQRARGGFPYEAAQLVTVSRSTTCVAALPPGQMCAADDDSDSPSLSTDGKQVAFNSSSNELVLGDTNQSCDGPCFPTRDAFVRTWTPPITAGGADLGSVHVGQESSPTPLTLTVGGFGPVVVDSVALAGVDGTDFFVDASGCTVRLHENDQCSLTVYFRPLTTGPKTATITVYADGTVTTPVVSAAVTGTGLPAQPVDPGTVDIVRTSVGSGNPGPQATHGTTDESMVSSNGRYDVLVSSDDLGGIKNGGTANIFVRDLRTNGTTQVSRAATTIGPPTAAGVPPPPVTSGNSSPEAGSSTPSISGDGRFVSFVTTAQNIVNVAVDPQGPDIVVMCDRGPPNAQGVFTLVQRCFNLDQEYASGDFPDQQPRLAPDGRHIVFYGCSDPVYYGNCIQTVVLVRISIDPGSGLAGVVDRTGIPTAVAGFDLSSVTQYQPQVSREGLPNLGPHGVRVVFGARVGLTAIVAADIRGDAGVAPIVVRQTRLDRVPGTSKYLGNVGSALVGDPSMSDDGTKVAWDYTNFSGGTAESYISTVSGSGVGPVTVSAKDVSRYRNDSTLPVRAADPALSGDGRYVSYVTDAPTFDGTVPDIPGYSCLTRPDEGGGTQTQGVCQVVSRDLVVDAKRRAAGQGPLPDALVTVSAAAPPCTSPPTAFGSSCGGDDDSFQPSMDRTGLHVGFDSYADDLVADDTNMVDAAQGHVSAQDAFVRTFHPKAVLSAVDFGSVRVGLSASRARTLSVVGFGPFVIDGSTVGGTNPGDFSVGDGTCTVQPDKALHFDQTCTVMITFTPAALGPRSGTVTIRGQDSPGVTITVRGTGARTPAGPAQFGATPNPVSFGSDLPLHTPGRTKNVTVSNAGGSPLTLTSVDVIDSSVPGARNDYAVDTADCGAVVAKGANCVIAVTWIGRAVGPRDAILRVVDNAPGGVNLIGLRANVPSPTISADPGVSPAGRVTMVTGAGFAPKRTVTLVLSDGPESTTVTTGAKGRFAAALIMFHNTVIGPRILVASVDGASATIIAQAPMLVVLGTVQSPDFKLRH